MDLIKLKAFFMWCTIINGALLILSFAGVVLAPEMAFAMHSRLFQISPQSAAESIYLLLGLYKILWFGFNLVPYVAVVIISKDK